MAYCEKCGAKVDDGTAYCPHCGARIPSGQNQQYGQYSGGQQEGQYGQGQQEGYFYPEDVKKNKLMAVLSYIGILVLVPLFAGDKSSEYLRHHVNQGLTIWIGSIIADILSGNGLFGLHIFSSSLWPVSVVGDLLSLVLFVFMIVGIVDACRGSRRSLPFVGSIKVV